MTTTYVATQVLGDAGIEALRQLQVPANQTGDFGGVLIGRLQELLSQSDYGNVNTEGLGAQLRNLGYAALRSTDHARSPWGLAITPEGKAFLKEWDELTK